ncbi:MAG TPA: porin [Cellvibrio sp.]|nr:porin [Cellvibrio sp.]
MKTMSSYCKKHSLAAAIALMISTPFANASDVTVSGFLSVGGGMVDEEYPANAQGVTPPNYKGYEEDFTFDNNLLGLQVTGTVSEKVTATAQLIARSADDYQVNSEWAYLTWQASDTVKVRAGRLRIPLYMYSDFIDVGYSYAWITPPPEVYFSPFNNVDGVDIYVSNTLGIFDATLQAYVGSFTDDFVQDGVVTNTKARNQIGVSGTIGKDWWTLRAAHHQSELTLDLSGVVLGPQLTLGGLAQYLTVIGFPENTQRLLAEEDDVTFTEIGINMDTGRFVAAAEYIEFDPGESMLSKNIRQYVMVGVRTGEWLFHVTASEAKDEVSRPEQGLPAGQPDPLFGNTSVIIGTLQAVARAQVVEREVMSLGTRWDVTTGTAIKFQYDDVDDEVGDQKVYSVALQTVF